MNIQSLEKEKYGFEIDVKHTCDVKLNSGDVFSELLRDCLKHAAEIKASDIHIEPMSKGLRIRMRVNGDLILWRTLDEPYKAAFIARAKAILNLDLATVDRPLDGRAEFDSFGVDVRVNSVPTIYGEKIVLRILAQHRSFNIHNSGLPDQTILDLLSVSKKKDGLVLISGPTGSGKTTTLYSLLQNLDLGRLNVSTLENPVEYRLDGLSQIDVGEKSISFSQGLRALMRQDPDVILVGEIRDGETAELCFKAASTGHLVFSTVHANGASEVVERLSGLGIDDLSIKSNLRFSGAQKLIKSVCQVCCLPSDGEAIKFANTLGISEKIHKDIITRNLTGCKACSNGIWGRMPLMEYLNAHHIALLLDGHRGEEFLQESIRREVKRLFECGIVDHIEAGEYL